VSGLRNERQKRETRRFIVTLVVGAAIYGILGTVYPSNDRGPAFIVLLAMGLVLALFVGQVVDRLLERRRLDRAATPKGRRP
jgi:hypothetical protein